MSKHPGWRHLNVNMVYKCREEDISSVLLIVAETKGRRFQKQLKKRLLHRHSYLQTHLKMF